MAAVRAVPVVRIARSFLPSRTPERASIGAIFDLPSGEKQTPTAVLAIGVRRSVTDHFVPRTHFVGTGTCGRLWATSLVITRRLGKPDGDLIMRHG
jgi:hypothetical protein